MSDIKQGSEQPARQVGGDEREQFEDWATPILGDNPTWRESGPCELAWQSWQARAALAPAAVVPEYQCYTTQPGESLGGIALRQLKDESRWIEIRDLNAHEFPDMWPHDYYPVGTVIRIARLNATPVTAAELEALRRDAGRYRWWRNRAGVLDNGTTWVLAARCEMYDLERQETDAAIDAAIAQQQEGAKP